MEALTRIVSDSLARYGLDRPVDPRRLQWSHWFRCDSPHSLLVVPSKPGLFAIAEEIMDLGSNKEHGEPPHFASAQDAGAAAIGTKHVGTAPQACPERAERVERGCPAERSSAACAVEISASAAEVISKRMLAVIQFSEDDNMAYVLDRMFTHINPLRSRLHSGNCFVRFVVVEDQQQRRTICAALNQWMRNSSEKVSGLPADFSSSLELPRQNVARAPSPAVFTVPAIRMSPATSPVAPESDALVRSAHAESGSNKNLHCPQPLPSGF